MIDPFSPARSGRLGGARSWLARIKARNLLEQRQAYLLQLSLLFVGTAFLVGSLSNALRANPVGNGVTANLTAAVVTGVLLVVLRRGFFRAVAWLTVGALIAALGQALANVGPVQGGTYLALLMVPIVLAGLILPRWGLLVSVTATGFGMDRETREHIFEPFFTTKQLGKGTGLGLATIYGIVRQAGGHIWLYSEPGRGSSFKLYFPRVDTPAEAAPPATLSPSIEGGTVMVVEDEPAVRNMVAQLLERAGYDVIAVGDGLEAMTAAASGQTIDVLVTDVVMPNMSGISLADQMMDRYPLLGVILLSGYTAETLNIERVAARGATFVPKPITSQRLIQAVHQAAALARAGSSRATDPS